jgi:dienelactone hydrolase
MLTATQPYTDLYMHGALKFKAHAPLYAVCWVYNRVPGYEFAAFTGAPVFIQAGELDTYDLPDTCAELVAATEARAPGVASLRVYPGATHAFDRSEPEITINDPFSHLGGGGEVTFRHNPDAAAQARDAVVAFFQNEL